MTDPANPLEVTPAQGSTNWWPDYDLIHTAINELQTALATLVPVNGPVITVNELAPDGTGNVVLNFSDVGAKADDYAPSYADLVTGTTLTVDKDPTTGFWPASWDASGNPIFTSGAIDQGTRPTANPLVTIRWRGPEPSPASVNSGTGGMLRGKDERVIPG